MKLCILFIMFFLHIVDDYYLQGILANLKQRKWWEEHVPAELYKNDYLLSLYTHAFSWSFVITLPLLIIAFISGYQPYFIFLILSYIMNTIIHAIVDNMKANEFKINLIQDQCAHYIQIFVTWGLFMLL